MPTASVAEDATNPAVLGLQERRVSANFAAVVVKNQTNSSDHDQHGQHDQQPYNIVINANDESPVDD